MIPVSAFNKGEHCKALINRSNLSGSCKILKETDHSPCVGLLLRAKAVDGLTAIEFKTDQKGLFSIKISPHKRYRIESASDSFEVDGEVLVKKKQRKQR